TMGTYFLGQARNYDKAVDNFAQLVKSYPADGAGHNNLAIAYFSRLEFQKALEEGRLLRDIYPKKPLYRSNYALYAMYAGEFETAATEAGELIKEDKTIYKAYLPIAMAALMAGAPAEARAEYAKMADADTGTIGESFNRIAVADLSMYEG